MAKLYVGNVGAMVYISATPQPESPGDSITEEWEAWAERSVWADTQGVEAESYQYKVRDVLVAAGCEVVIEKEQA